MNTNTRDDIHIHRLDNGFTIAMERLPYLHSASIGVWVKTGSAAEKEHEAGLAHFLEHLFFKGTKNRTTHQIMEAIEASGGHLNAATSREYTTVYVRMLKEHVNVGIEVLADVVINSLFGDINRERNVILEEIASIEDTPDELSQDLLSSFHWPSHPLGRPITGYAEHVEKMKLLDFRRFYRTWYRPRNMVFSIAGNFDEDAVLHQVEDAFSGLENNFVPRMDRVPLFQSGIKMETRSISQTHIGVAMPGPASSDEKRYTSHLMSQILGGGATSRLFEIIREKAGLAYSVYAYQSNYIPTGMVGIYEAVAPHNSKQALDLTFQELQRLRDEPISEKELEQNREQVKGGILMALESTYTRMGRMAKGLLFRGRVMSVEEITAGIEAVSVNDIQDFAQEIFRADSCAVVLLGPSETHVPEKVPL